MRTTLWGLSALLVLAVIVHAGTTNFDSLGLSGDLTVTGDATVTGDLAVTGAQTFAGNQAVAGNLDVTGATTATTATFTGAVTVNDGSNPSSDFRVESNGQTDALFVDASTDRVGVLTSVPTHDFEVDGAVGMASTLQVTGNVNFDGTLDIAGATQVDDDFNVTGSTTVVGLAATGHTTVVSLTGSGRISTSDVTQMRVTEFIPWQDFVTGQVTGASTVFSGFGAGSPVTTATELGGAGGLGGFLVGAASDEFETLWNIPFDFDRTQDTTFFVLFYVDAEAESGDSITWSLDYAEIVPGTTVIGDPATAPNTDFSAAAWAADGVVQGSGMPPATINGGTIGATTSLLHLEFIVATLTNYSADEVTFVGVVVNYGKLFL